jgi:flagellar biosynthesis GTPase FlhF
MSNLYNYFVNQKTVSFITTEFIDNNKVDVSNQQNLAKVQSVVKNVLDETYGLLDKSKISKNNITDAIDKFVNVALKRLNIQPRNRNIAAPVNMRMPAQYSTNTRLIPETNNEGLDSRYNKYMEQYKNFNKPVSEPNMPDWLQPKSTNPKRMMDEKMKNSPLDNFKGTATRKNNVVFNDSNNDKNEIEDYAGSSNFSYFTDTPEVTSAFDEAFYNTGINPDNVNDNINESLDERLKKMESDRSTLKSPDKKIDNIDELFKNDSEFKKHMQNNQESIQSVSSQNNKQQQQKQQQQYQQQMTQAQQQYQQQQYQQQYQQQMQQQQQYQQPQFQQFQQYQNNDIQENMMKMMEREKQYQLQLKMLGGKLSKYEEYLKTLMARYNDLKIEKDELRQLLNNRPTQDVNINKVNPNLELIEEKKRQLLKLSSEVQEKIARLEQLQSLTQSNPQTEENDE